MYHLRPWCWVLANVLCSAPHVRAGLDQALGQELESIYAQYRQALTQQNTKGWLNFTSRYRQMALRNQVVSQGLPWPRAVFDLALKPPAAGSLKMIDATAQGEIARLSYFGKIDFGIPGEAAPDNALVIWFLREGTAWKYNTLQYANLNADPALKLLVAQGDAAFLRNPEFALPATPPEVPKPCEAPYHVAHLSVIARGGRATVTVNGVNEEIFDAVTATRTVIGGLRKGPNKIRITLTPNPGVPAEKLQLSVTLTSPTDQPAKPEQRLFQWQFEPGKSALPYETTLWGGSKVNVGP